VITGSVFIIRVRVFYLSQITNNITARARSRPNLAAVVVSQFVMISLPTLQRFLKKVEWIAAVWAHQRTPNLLSCLGSPRPLLNSKKWPSA